MAKRRTKAKQSAEEEEDRGERIEEKDQARDRDREEKQEEGRSENQAGGRRRQKCTLCRMGMMKPELSRDLRSRSQKREADAGRKQLFTNRGDEGDREMLARRRRN
eukprot:319020-Hanusia_phi.AAC.1